MKPCNSFRAHLWSILVLINGIWIIASEKCDKNDLHRCTEMMKPLSENPNLAAAFEGNEDKITRACRELFPESMKCINNYVNLCYPAQREVIMSSFSGLKAFMENLCDADSSFRSDILKYGQCFSEAEAEEKGCHENYSRDHEAIDETTMTKEEKERLNCCMMNSFTHCMEAAVLKKCGQSAARLINQTFEMTGGELFRFCRNFQEGSLKCSPASSSSVTMPTLLSFTFLCIVLFKY